MADFKDIFKTSLRTNLCGVVNIQCACFFFQTRPGPG